MPNKVPEKMVGFQFGAVIKKEGLRLTYKLGSDLDDFQAWDAYLGRHAEGEIVWRKHELEGLKPGWTFSGYWPNNHLKGECVVYDSFFDCAKAFEEELLGIGKTLPNPLRNQLEAPEGSKAEKGGN